MKTFLVYLFGSIILWAVLGTIFTGIPVKDVWIQTFQYHESTGLGVIYLIIAAIIAVGKSLPSGWDDNNNTDYFTEEQKRSYQEGGV